MTFILGCVYIVIGLILSYFIIESLVHKEFNSAFFMRVGLVVYYIIPFINLCFANLTGYESRYGGIEPSVTGLAMVLLFIVGLSIGKNSNVSFVIRRNKERRGSYFIPREKEVVLRLSIGISVFSFMIFVLYCSLYGGIDFVLRNISNIRGSVVTSSNARYEFLGKLFNCVILSPVLLFPYCMSSEIAPEKRIPKKWFYLMFALALLIKVSSGSRGALLTYLMIFLISTVIKKPEKVFENDRKKHGWIIKGVILFIFAIIVYRPLLNVLGTVDEVGLGNALSNLFKQLFSDNGSKYSLYSIGDTFTSLIRSFEHYVVSLETAIKQVNSGNHSMNFFGEFFIMLQSVIPSFVFGITKMNDVTYYNSAYISGVYGVTQIPPGIIASGYYSGSFVWVFLYGLIFGHIGRSIDNYYEKIKDNVGYATSLYVALLFIYFFFSISGDFSSQFKKNFTTFIWLFLINRQYRVLSSS